jgi:DNA invertase Pin-like site-specific DNA recombinase
LKAAGCEVVHAEKRGGTTTQGREELRTVLDFLRKGDVLIRLESWQRAREALVVREK